jgi:hypothetical protein
MGKCRTMGKCICETLYGQMSLNPIILYASVVFFKQYPVFICRANFTFVVTITAFTSIDMLLIAR